MLISSTNVIINVLARRLISIKCVTWLVDVELLVSDMRAPAVQGTRTVAGTDNCSGGILPRPPVIPALFFGYFCGGSQGQTMFLMPRASYPPVRWPPAHRFSTGSIMGRPTTWITKPPMQGRKWLETPFNKSEIFTGVNLERLKKAGRVLRLLEWEGWEESTGKLQNSRKCECKIYSIIPRHRCAVNHR